MRIRIRAGLAVTAGLALALASGVAQAAQVSRPGIAEKVAAAAPPAGLAAAAPQTAKLLYGQYNYAGGYEVASQNEGKGNSYDAQGADDFTVPKGQTWTISEVSLPGTEGSGSFTVFLYKNTVKGKEDLPGAPVTKETLDGTFNNGWVVITGIKGVTLPAGHYWLSVEGDTPAGLGWYWETRAAASGSPAVWRNPGNGFDTGCTTWSEMQVCLKKAVAPELKGFMFGLYGSRTG